MEGSPVSSGGGLGRGGADAVGGFAPRSVKDQRWAAAKEADDSIFIGAWNP